MKTDVNKRYQDIASLIPVLRNRANGSILALTPPGAIVKFGVVGKDATEAVSVFEETRESWAQLLSSDRHR